jgi:hypothetical protein
MSVPLRLLNNAPYSLFCLLNYPLSHPGPPSPSPSPLSSSPAHASPSNACATSGAAISSNEPNTCPTAGGSRDGSGKLEDAVVVAVILLLVVH